MVISPYAKCKSDEDFVDRIRQKTKELLLEDEHFGKLIYLLALFTPVQVQLQEEEKQMFKHFQQKVSIMIYSHLMERLNPSQFFG